ncbi:MAG: rhomboid family intramembrane serine protease [Tahibacter sp.]
MLFIPYKLDIGLYRIPFLTALVCLVCIVTFTTQLASRTTYVRRVTSYCAQGLDPNLEAILAGVGDDSGFGPCIGNFLAIRKAGDRDATIAALARSVKNLTFYPDKAADLAYKTAKIASGFDDFDLSVPQQLTENLAYDPEHRDFVRMLTSTFAHADWSHLLGNLLFFFIFASCLESAIGYGYFAVAFVVMAVASSIAYSLSVSNSESALPTIGLSGVVMGMMVMITALMPKARIWCLFWILLIVRRFTLPLFVIALWYVGWNVYDFMHDDGASHINYMAHIGGAISGLVMGVLFALLNRDRMRAIASEMPH